jgi:hypothetical protein
MRQVTIENYINHIALVLDASGSMDGLKKEVVQVADNQIAYLAKRSKELDQETRVSVYLFEGRKTQCLIYDKDVLRLPSINGLYSIGGNTPLIDATLRAIDDLGKTPELYGEHAFLTYVITDGEENSSTNTAETLKKTLNKLPDNWTVAVFVPNANGVYEAKKFGFEKDNIAVWDASAKGVKEVGEVLRRTTEQFMTARASGIRGYKNLFKLDLNNISTKAVQKLDKLGPGQFRMLKVDDDSDIAGFVEYKVGRPYKLGEGYYQLTKPVKVQPQKQIAIYDKKAHAVYTGANARKLIGLDVNYEVKVEPASLPNYEIFIQSTSVNRKLFAGTKLLILS